MYHTHRLPYRSGGIYCGLVRLPTYRCIRASSYSQCYALFTIGGLSVLPFIRRFGLFTFMIAQRFSSAKRRDAEGVCVVHTIARFDGTTSTLREDDLRDVDERIARLRE